MTKDTMKHIMEEVRKKAEELDCSVEEAAADFIYKLIYTLDAEFSFSTRNRKRFQDALHSSADTVVQIKSKLVR